jgi:hypothetical protein
MRERVKSRYVPHNNEIQGRGLLDQLTNEGPRLCRLQWLQAEEDRLLSEPFVVTGKMFLVGPVTAGPDQAQLGQRLMQIFKSLKNLAKLVRKVQRLFFHSVDGSVALTSGSAVMPWPICGSGGNIEQLVDELDLALDVGLAQDAMASSDHAHDLEAFNGGVGGSHRLETASGTDPI